MPSHTINENDSTTIAHNHVFNSQLRDIGSGQQIEVGHHFPVPGALIE